MEQNENVYNKNEEEKILGEILNDIILPDAGNEEVKKKKSLEREIDKIRDKNLSVFVDKPRDLSGDLLNPPYPRTPVEYKRISSDGLVKLARSGKQPNKIINKIIEELSEEAAFMKIVREIEEETDPRDAISISKKRADILKGLLSILVTAEKNKDKQDKSKIDFKGPRFQRIFRYFLNAIQSTFDKINMSKELQELFFAELSKSLEGFEDIAEKLYNSDEDIELAK